MKKKMKYVKLVRQMEGFNIWWNVIITTTQATQLFEAVKQKFEHPSIDEKVRRCKSIGWKTYYNIMTKHKWKFTSEV
jgi:mRNA deadenylase 3'-5' endonuclease subunit Ccr4